MAKLIGEWSIDWDRYTSRGWPSNLKDLVSSKAPDVLGGSIVDDLSATSDENRRACDPYLKIIPFGPNSTAANDTVQDGDILCFISQTFNASGTIGLLQQRGWHAEICYKKDGITHQRAPWNDCQRDKPCDEGNEEWMIHIFRPRLSGIDSRQIIELKQQVRLWKEIFSTHRFPQNNELFPGSEKYFDPADFGSVPEIEMLACKLVSRQDVPKVTCVQWAYQVLCLSLCVPLNEHTLTRLGVYQKFCENWPGLVGKTSPDINGYHRLPFIPYSPAQILQSLLNTYANETPLWEALKNPAIETMLIGMLSTNFPPEVAQNIRLYLDSVVQSKDITLPLKTQSRTYRFVMPITFFCEARLAAKKQPDEPWLQYIGTMVHESLVKRAE